MKRFFDIICSLVGLIILSPLFLLVAFWIKLDSKGGVFYLQERIGKNQIPFKLYKFRSMRPFADQVGQLTVGMKDPRITRSGYFIRKFKIDELPQLINVFIGDMSLVGPRPEVAKYVKLYNTEQLKVLSIRPGITDWASLKYFSENELLGNAENPEQVYIEEIMPQKLALNLEYVHDNNWLTDLKIILLTLKKIVA